MHTHELSELHKVTLAWVDSRASKHRISRVIVHILTIWSDGEILRMMRHITLMLNKLVSHIHMHHMPGMFQPGIEHVRIYATRCSMELVSNLVRWHTVTERSISITHMMWATSRSTRVLWMHLVEQKLWRHISTRELTILRI